MGFMAFELLTNNLGSRPRANTIGEGGGVMERGRKTGSVGCGVVWARVNFISDL